MSNLKEVRTQITKGDVILSKHKTSLISAIIANVSHGNYSHAFICIEDNKILESGPKGVVIRDLEHYLNDEYDIGLFRYSPFLTRKQRNEVVKRSKKLLGVRYGYLQIVWLFLLHLIGKSEDPKWGIDVSKGMICSEVIAYVHAEMGLKFTNLTPSQVEPVDIDMSSQFIRVA